MVGMSVPQFKLRTLFIATTLCAVTRDKEYLGGIITPFIGGQLADRLRTKMNVGLPWIRPG
jgi:hypothetical protein